MVVWLAGSRRERCRDSGFDSSRTKKNERDGESVDMNRDNTDGELTEGKQNKTSVDPRRLCISGPPSTITTITTILGSSPIHAGGGPTGHRSARRRMQGRRAHSQGSMSKPNAGRFKTLSLLLHSEPAITTKDSDLYSWGKRSPDTDQETAGPFPKGVQRPSYRERLERSRNVHGCMCSKSSKGGRPRPCWRFRGPRQARRVKHVLGMDAERLKTRGFCGERFITGRMCR